MRVDAISCGRERNPFLEIPWFPTKCPPGNGKRAGGTLSRGFLSVIAPLFPFGRLPCLFLRIPRPLFDGPLIASLLRTAKPTTSRGPCQTGIGNPRGKLGRCSAPPAPDREQPWSFVTSFRRRPFPSPAAWSRGRPNSWGFTIRRLSNFPFLKEEQYFELPQASDRGHAKARIGPGVAKFRNQNDPRPP